MLFKICYLPYTLNCVSVIAHLQRNHFQCSSHLALRPNAFSSSILRGLTIDETFLLKAYICIFYFTAAELFENTIFETIYQTINIEGFLKLLKIYINQ